MDRALRYAYFHPNSPAAFSSVPAVYHEAKKHFKSIKVKDVKEWLHKQNTYTLHKQVKRHHIQRNRVIAAGYDSDWQADLCNMQTVAKHNGGVSHILTCIDVLSKYGWAVPVKTKSATDVAKAFAKIVKKGRKPWRLFTDRGTEFTGKPFQEFLQYMDIHHLTSKNKDTKASVCERYNRTLKSRLWKYFTQQQSFHWLKMLPSIVAAINKSYHRSIKRRPVDVTPSNQNEVWQTLYGERPKTPITFHFKTGDAVRIARSKHVFEKGYVANFSRDVYTVAKTVARRPPVYRLEKQNGEQLAQVFYENQLVPFEGHIPKPRKKTRQLPMLKKRRRRRL
jgi:hypothetical protein